MQVVGVRRVEDWHLKGVPRYHLRPYDPPNTGCLSLGVSFSVVIVLIVLIHAEPLIHLVAVLLLYGLAAILVIISVCALSLL